MESQIAGGKVEGKQLGADSPGTWDIPKSPDIRCQVFQFKLRRVSNVERRVSSQNLWEIEKRLLAVWVLWNLRTRSLYPGKIVRWAESVGNIIEMS